VHRDRKKPRTRCSRRIFMFTECEIDMAKAVDETAYEINTQLDFTIFGKM
jgi:hypothetical protein